MNDEPWKYTETPPPPSDGGPAFPQHTLSTLEGDYPGSPGMSLRDWFAGQEQLTDYSNGECPEPRLGEMLAGREKPAGAWCFDHYRWEAEWRSALKYIRADAMMKAREQ
jgi:hypothetical protein